MELRNSSPKSRELPLPDYISDPEETEISDDDDDDRNHKHRRRETRSQSMERDPLDQVLTRPYRKRNKPFENGMNPLSESGRYNSKFDKRRPGGANISRFSSDINQRNKGNPSFSSDAGSGRGRGRGSTSWQPLDLRFNSVDVAPQIPHPGSLPSAMFPGRGLPNPSNLQNASWSGFGLLPGIPNGGMDAVHPLGLQGTLRPAISPSLNVGIPRQRCRDFEERGFCLRGDMCPMEHGVNRIVVEDVQSLSQFNLPVSLPSAHLLGTSPGSGFVPPVSASPGPLIYGKGLLNRSGEPPMDVDGYNLGGDLSGAVDAGGADVYDPDQPLWTNDLPETSTALLGSQPTNLDQFVPLMDADPSDRLISSGWPTVGSHGTSSSVWGRLNSSKNRSELKEKFDTRMKSEYTETKIKEIHETSGSIQETSQRGKQFDAEELGPKAADSSSKSHNDNGNNVRKPSQKAQRTLFVNRIPLTDNKKQNLLSHFRKFGKVVDIYIPSNSERAFVQFSKREEAETALKAPDAVMGNRFIRLWWANRDIIPDEGTSSDINTPITPRGVLGASGPATPSPAAVASKGKVDGQPDVKKVNVSQASDRLVITSNDTKPVTANCPKVPPPPSQKKLESLELLKEELRKKQEMLDQKRNEFRQQLDKLAKQAPGTKGEIPAEQAAKRPKVATGAEAAGPGNQKSSASIITGTSSQAKSSAEKIGTAENVASQSPRVNPGPALQDASRLKPAIRPLAPLGSPFPMNRYKLDNRPTAFRVNAPLPAGFANVAAVRDHFSAYGEISNVEIEDLRGQDEHNGIIDSESMKNCSAIVHFTSRHTAEKAFISGKTWNGHTLQLSWVTPSTPSGIRTSKRNSSAPPTGPSGVEDQSAEKSLQDKISSVEVLSAEKLMPDPNSGLEVQSAEKSVQDKNSDVEVKSAEKSMQDKSSGVEVQSAEKSVQDTPEDRSHLKENSPSALKEPSNGGVGSSVKLAQESSQERFWSPTQENSPPAPKEQLTDLAQSPEKSVNYIPLQTDGTPCKDSEVLERDEGAGDLMETDENRHSSPMPIVGEIELPNGEIC